MRIWGSCCCGFSLGGTVMSGCRFVLRANVGLIFDFLRVSPFFSQASSRLFPTLSRISTFRFSALLQPRAVAFGVFVDDLFFGNKTFHKRSHAKGFLRYWIVVDKLQYESYLSGMEQVRNLEGLK